MEKLYPLQGDGIMNTTDIAQYVDAACALHELTLAPEVRARVIETFTRTAIIAEPLLAFELPAELEIAHTFKA
jgi:hypothetical protein